MVKVRLVPTDEEGYALAAFPDGSAEFFPYLPQWGRGEKGSRYFRVMCEIAEYGYEIVKLENGFAWQHGHPGEGYLERSQERFPTPEAALASLRYYHIREMVAAHARQAKAYADANGIQVADLLKSREPEGGR